MGKYGTNVTGLGAYEGGVNNDKGSPLVANNTDGETSLLFGPAALREIQAGVANGDFAIPPDQATATIAEDNPLPYWTFTDVSSAGAITCAIVADATSGSGNKLRWSVAANTPSGRSAKITRFVPIFGTQNQAFSYAAELTAKCSVLSGTMSVSIQQDFYEADQVTTVGSSTFVGSVFSTVLTTVSTGLSPSSALAVPPSAAFVKLTIGISVSSTSPGTVSTCDVFEIRLLRGDQALFVAEQTAPGTFAPTLIQQSSGVLSILSPGRVQIDGANSLYVSRASVASAAQSLTNNTSTTILLDTASTTPTTGTYDPKSWFNNANDRIAVGQAGFYAVTANLAFAANATGRRTLTIAVNGSDAGSVQVLASPAGTTILSVSTNLYLAAGDLVTMTALQQSGGALNTVVVAGVYPALSVGRIGA